METAAFYEELLIKFKELVTANSLFDEQVIITGRVLSDQEAIGNPLRQDFPLLKGKEKLMQAEFEGVKGQAFTDMPGSFKGTLKDVLQLPLVTNYERAVFIATLNAVCRYVGLTNHTIHCRDEEPEMCSKRLVEYIKKNYNSPRVALIGLQPAILESLAGSFPVRVVDLDPDKVGKNQAGILVEPLEVTSQVLQWCDLIVATGSTIANGTLPDYLDRKPVLFYGTTIAAAACLMGLNRHCPLAG